MTRAKPVKPSEAEPEQRDVNVLDQAEDKADVKVQVENMHPGNFTGPGPQHKKLTPDPGRYQFRPVASWSSNAVEEVQARTSPGRAQDQPREVLPVGHTGRAQARPPTNGPRSCTTSSPLRLQFGRGAL